MFNLKQTFSKSCLFYYIMFVRSRDLIIFGSDNQLSPLSSPYIFSLESALCLRCMDINKLSNVGSDPICKSVVINPLTVFLHLHNTDFKNMEGI
jgi:hypothetical protein